MSQSEWKRNPAIEDAYNEMHKIKPKVYYKKDAREKYHVKLVIDDKEVTLTEVMDRGLTKNVTLAFGDKSKNCESMYKAEKEATKLLRGDKWQQ